MKIHTINDFYTFLEKETENNKNQIYRGMRNSEWKLVPSVGRIKDKNGNNLTVEQEKLLLKVFKHRAYPFIKDYIDNDIELLTIGQHHGLPTRVLDWTKNPLVGMYFAVEEPFTAEDEKETDYSALIIYEPKSKVTLDKKFDPFSIKDVERYHPKHWDKRIISQGGLFTVHNEPYKSWHPKGRRKILIHKGVRIQLKNH